MKNLEIKTILYKGIDVVVKIDYDASTATIVEAQKGSIPVLYQPKNWVFSKRGLEYMNGWLTILEAITFAVKEIKKDLEQDLAEKTKFKEKQEEVIIKAVIGSNKKKK